MNTAIFRAYDVRGKVPDDLNESDAVKIGAAFGSYLLDLRGGAKTRVGIGRDDRLSSPIFANAVIGSLRALGIDVIDIGLAPSPFFYFAIAHLQLDGGLNVTASHNPPEFNGFKYADGDGLPLEGAAMDEIKKRALSEHVTPPASVIGTLSHTDVMEDYIARNLVLIPLRPSQSRIIIDTGNGVSARMIEAFFHTTHTSFIPLFFEMDGSFPNRLPNPLEEKNIHVLKKKIVDERADFGVALDADGDRIVFVDEKGYAISPDLITALLAQEILRQKPGESILYDLRSSHAVPEAISVSGGTPHISRVGHTFIKQLMRETDALFAGELSGHYYFRDIGFFEAPLMVLTIIMNACTRTGLSLSTLIAPFQKYHTTGEINFTVAHPHEVLERLKKQFADASAMMFLDGITIEYPDWWCNVRSSNTENVLRLNLEAHSPALRDQMLAILTTCITQI